MHGRIFKNKSRNTHPTFLLIATKIFYSIALWYSENYVAYVNHCDYYKNSLQCGRCKRYFYIIVHTQTYISPHTRDQQIKSSWYIHIWFHLYLKEQNETKFLVLIWPLKPSSQVLGQLSQLYFFFNLCLCLWGCGCDIDVKARHVSSKKIPQHDIWLDMITEVNMILSLKSHCPLSNYLLSLDSKLCGKRKAKYDANC